MITEYFKTCERGDSVTAEALLKRRWAQSVRDWGWRLWVEVLETSEDPGNGFPLNVQDIPRLKIA